MSEQAKNVLFYGLAIIICVWLIATWRGIKAGEMETAWRRGDITLLPLVCNTQEHAEKLAVLVESQAPKDLEVAQNCMVPNEGDIVVGLLDGWVSGPYSWNESGNVSVWKVIAPNGARGWAVIPDVGGTHQKAIEV